MSYDTSVAEQFALLLQRRTRQQVLIAAFGRFALKQIGRPALMQEAARLAAEGLHASFAKVLEHEAATDTLHTAPRYTITQIIDRLGAGDAFTAGLIFSFLQNSDPQTAISFATAAGCLAHSIEGDYNYSTRSEIETFMQGDGGGRVSR